MIRKKGRVELRFDSCATCHTRVMPDGRVIKSVQGNFAYEEADAYAMRARVEEMADLKAFVAGRL